MPSDQINILGSFQDYDSKILVKKLDIFLIVYLNDIIIYIEFLRKGQDKVVWWVLEVFRKYNLYANLKKCRFYQNEFRFLSFIITTNDIRMEEKRIDALKKWPKPKSVEDI